jgi:hypothetical protein
MSSKPKVSTVNGGQQIGYTNIPSKKGKGKNKKKGGGATQMKKKGKNTKNVKMNPGRALVHKQTCSITDPFCPHAYGARLPGSGNVVTIPLTSRVITPLTTSTSLAKGFWFFPDWDYGFGSSTATDATNITSPVTLTKWPLSASKVADDYCAEGRVVSAGFIIRCSSIAANIQGTVWIVPAPRILANTVYTIPPVLTDPRVVVQNITKDMEIVVNCVRKSSEALNFGAALTGSGDQPAYQGWLVYLPPTSTTTIDLSIEMVVHMEGTLKQNQEDIVSLVSTNNTTVSTSGATVPISNRVSAAVPSVVAKSTGSAVSMFSSYVEQTAEKAIKSFVDDPITSIESLFALF